jgi:hypothetical protein
MNAIAAAFRAAIRIAGPLDSIVAHSDLATDFFNSIGHGPPSAFSI